MFANRDETGRRLGQLLADRSDLAGPGTVVLGLPRGGVPVAARVAEALDAPLDLVGVAKLRHPGQPEFALGALGEGGVRIVAREPSRSGVSEQTLARIERIEVTRLRAQVARLRRGRDRVRLRGRTAVVVDDGVATGSTARAACAAARRAGASRVILAVPVAPAGLADRLPEADELVVLSSPEPFGAVGQYYRDFSPVEEDVVLAELAAADRRTGN